jgi:hypothetical protein
LPHDLILKAGNFWDHVLAARIGKAYGAARQEPASAGPATDW